LEEWEGEIAKYEREYKKTVDADLKLAILSEVAPKTLAPQIAMHSAHLTTYKTLREFIVQYLKSKNLWKRGAGTAFGTQSASPAAPYSGPGQHPWRLERWKRTTSQNQKVIKVVRVIERASLAKVLRLQAAKVTVKVRIRARPMPAMPTPQKDLRVQFVAPNHTTEACYFNARSFPKGDGKGKRTSTSSSTNVNAVDGTVPDNGELTSTIAALQQQLEALRLTGASSVSASSTSSAIVGRRSQSTQGAISQKEQPMLFAVAEAEVAEAVCSTMQGDGGQKYILVDSSATTSCASAKHFPSAALDASKRKQLWAVNGTPIQQQGELAAHTTLSATTADGVDVKMPARFRLDSTDITEPVMAFCRILDDADCDMHFYRSSSGKPAHIQTPDDHTIVLPRFGSLFYMPFEDRTSGAAPPAFVAAQRHEDDVSALPLPPKNRLRRMAASTSTLTWMANRSHLNHVIFLHPLRPRTTSEHCTTSPMLISHHGAAIALLARRPSLDTIGKSRTQMLRCLDYEFFSREGQLVEEESRAAIVLTATDTSSGWPLMVFVPEKGLRDQSDSVMD
ncbi:unnamed protein product, partial [Symbiodinium sp. CCMP2456]